MSYITVDRKDKIVVIQTQVHVYVIYLAVLTLELVVAAVCVD